MAETDSKTVKKHQEIMNYLISEPYILLEKEAAKLPVETAKSIWQTIEPVFSKVCQRAGMGRRNVRDQWTSLMRKMILIEKRSKEEEEPEGKESISE